jgi:acetoin:2,6-dichlorophenolindophenol oxidoreductase subunit alpha
VTATMELDPTTRIDPAVLAGIYFTAVKIKLYDDAYISALKTGRAAGMYYSPRGQEIIPSAFGQVLRTDDYVLTIYRGIHDQIAKGVPLRELTAEFFGRSTGTCKGKGGPMHVTHPESGLIVTTGVVGSGLPIGVGVALSAQMRGTDQVTVVNFGDGASNIGAFHEALNLASVWNLPVVFVCQNNQYAEYTAYSLGTSAKHVADRAIGYSMRSFRVNGNDPVEMYEAARLAVEAARAGQGPTLIEAETYRFRGHTPGDPMEYIPKADLAEAINADPVPLLRQRLIDEGIATEESLTALETTIKAEIDDALAFAEASPQPDLSELYTDL